LLYCSNDARTNPGRVFTRRMEDRKMLTTLQNETRDGTIGATLARLRAEQSRKVDAVVTEGVHVHPVVLDRFGGVGV
jgi:hypothetical protein